MQTSPALSPRGVPGGGRRARAAAAGGGAPAARPPLSLPAGVGAGRAQGGPAVGRTPPRQAHGGQRWVDAICCTSRGGSPLGQLDIDPTNI